MKKKKNQQSTAQKKSQILRETVISEFDLLKTFSGFKNTQKNDVRSLIKGLNSLEK